MTKSLLTLLVLLACPIILWSQVLTGADVLVNSRLQLLAGKRVGIVTNQTGRLRSGEFLVDALVSRGVHVTALFGPEHGIRGNAGPGEEVRDTLDLKGIPVYSLYGATTKPTPRMLDSVDVLIYDIQDVGVRFFTYITTMYFVMEAGAEQHVPIVVLDRPDPLGGVVVDGPVLEDSLRSFVGIVPIPVVYGLTCGELARMINGEKWLKGGMHAELTVVPMQGWTRSMLWNETGLTWVPPSPNITDVRSCYGYPVTCFLEATNISEGRGTPEPFLMIGAPFVNADALAATLGRAMPSIRWEPTAFTPTSSKYKAVPCHGVRLAIDSPPLRHPISCAVSLLRVLKQSYAGRLTIQHADLLRLSGSSLVPESVEDSLVFRNTEKQWQQSCIEFIHASASYLLYK